MAEEVVMDIEKICKIIPHRYPFLLVDRIVELVEGSHAVGIKNVTANEPFFNGHFPEYRVMPGVLQVEALAQVSGILVSNEADSGNKIGFFAAMNNVRFKRQVVPGDQLRLESKVIKHRRGVGKFEALATVDGEVTCTAELTLMFK